MITMIQIMIILMMIRLIPWWRVATESTEHWVVEPRFRSLEETFIMSLRWRKYPLATPLRNEICGDGKGVLRIICCRYELLFLLCWHDHFDNLDLAQGAHMQANHHLYHIYQQCRYMNINDGLKWWWWWNIKQCTFPLVRCGGKSFREI